MEKPSTAGRGRPSDPEVDGIDGLAATLREGDGLDPREEARRRRRALTRGPGAAARGLHQQERFVSQVQMAIDGALQAAATPILNALCVREVVPQGGALLVIVAPREPNEPIDVGAATRALDQAASMLRREVASAITRKVTPNLTFVVLPAGAERIEE